MSRYLVVILSHASGMIIQRVTGPGGKAVTHASAAGGVHLYLAGSDLGTAFSPPQIRLGVNGDAECVVQSFTSSPSRLHCIVAAIGLPAPTPVYAASGTFLDVPLFAYHNTDSHADCWHMGGVNHGCFIRFDLAGTPRISSVLTPMLEQGSELRIAGQGIDGSEMWRPAWELAPIGAITCGEGSSTASLAECAEAVASLTSVSGSSTARALVQGSGGRCGDGGWGDVPLGCNFGTSPSWDGRGRFKTSGPGNCVNTAWRLVCTSGRTVTPLVQAKLFRAEGELSLGCNVREAESSALLAHNDASRHGCRLEKLDTSIPAGRFNLSVGVLGRGVCAKALKPQPWVCAEALRVWAHFRRDKDSAVSGHITDSCC